MGGGSRGRGQGTEGRRCLRGEVVGDGVLWVVVVYVVADCRGRVAGEGVLWVVVVYVVAGL